jgi:hypothetical protein
MEKTFLTIACILLSTSPTLAGTLPVCIGNNGILRVDAECKGNETPIDLATPEPPSLSTLRVFDSTGNALGLYAGFGSQSINGLLIYLEVPKAVVHANGVNGALRAVSTTGIFFDESDCRGRAFLPIGPNRVYVGRDRDLSLRAFAPEVPGAVETFTRRSQMTLTNFTPCSSVQASSAHGVPATEYTVDQLGIEELPHLPNNPAGFRGPLEIRAVQQ